MGTAPGATRVRRSTFALERLGLRSPERGWRARRWGSVLRARTRAHSTDACLRMRWMAWRVRAIFGGSDGASDAIEPDGSPQASACGRRARGAARAGATDDRRLAAG